MNNVILGQIVRILPTHTQTHLCIKYTTLSVHTLELNYFVKFAILITLTASSSTFKSLPHAALEMKMKQKEIKQQRLTFSPYFRVMCKTYFAKRFPKKKKNQSQTETAQSGWLFSAFNQKLNN